MKIIEVLTKYVHSDVDKILKNIKNRQKEEQPWATIR